jgi:hypothetical protein
MATREPLRTVQEVAKLFDKQERTVRRWIADGAPHRKRSRRVWFLLSELVPWREANRGRDESEDPDKAKEEARRLKEDADRLALANAQKRRELVPAHQVAQQWERVLGVLRSRITAARGRWAPRIIGLGTMAEATAVLDGLADELLTALRASADELEDGMEDDEPDEDAA